MLHEIDHLNGILFIDRMEKEARGAVDEAVKALAKRTRDGRTAAPT
jgi:peptide deformylase